MYVEFGSVIRNPQFLDIFATQTQFISF